MWKKKIILGTAQFGMNYGVSNFSGRITLLEGKKILEFALDSNVFGLDTAASYGSSEKTLGALGSNNFKIITKLPKYFSSKENIFDWTLKAVKSSLKKLKAKELYGLLIHDSKMLYQSNAKELYRVLTELRDSGLITKIGLSIYNPEELEILKDFPEISLIQAPLNVFDRRLIATGWADRLKEQNIELHARSIFLQGLLLMNEPSLPKYFLRWDGTLRKWFSWLQRNNFSALDVCLQYVLSIEQVNGLVLGVHSLAHLREIMDSLDKSINMVNSFPMFELQDEELLNPSLWAM